MDKREKDKIISELKRGMKLIVASGIVMVFIQNIIPDYRNVEIAEETEIAETAEALNTLEAVNTSSYHVSSVSDIPLTEPTITTDEAISDFEFEATVEIVSTETTDISSEQTSLININTANSAQLQTLKGIGEVKAQAIIDYRNANGNFSSVDELINVSGIGEKTLENIRPYITV